ncbi:AbrB/MazE/SpoVT family DNA-binding domain-containing protein [bacterium]|nr:AbrB/MazE/SpoVT family DNA-binding domain-containing protein [bacterium]
MLAKRTFKNQVTIPKRIIEKFPGIDYFDVVAGEEEIILRPVEIKRSKYRLAKIREKISSLGLTERDIQDAVRWARKRA